jgi:hypothetical protein
MKSTWKLPDYKPLRPHRQSRSSTIRGIQHRSGAFLFDPQAIFGLKAPVVRDVPAMAAEVARCRSPLKL